MPKMSVFRTVLCLGILVLLCTDVRTWRRRRRRRCTWSWGGWSACSAPCGYAGTQTRRASGCGAPGPETRACNRFCNNGGTPQATYCDCPDEFWNICCESPCTAIANCERLICTSASNHQCNRCNYDRGGQIKAYQQVASGGYPNRVCEQRCSWRPDSKFCYPGRCPGTPSTCSCAPGFGGDNCLRVSTQPTIMHCLAKLQRVVGGAERDTLEADCGAVTATSTVYVGRHIAFNRLQMTWDSSWIGPTASDWPRPYYINDFRVGIVTASSTWRLLRGGSALRSGTIGCSIGHSQDNPDTNLHDCVNHGDLSLPTLQHNDRLEFKAKATNGGYVRINNYDSSSGTPTLNPRQYYQGSEVIHTAHFTYDLRDPVHCSVASSCSSKLVEIGPSFTKNGHIQIRWPGWSDEGSGLGKYEYVVYKLQPYGDELGMRSVTPILSGSQNVSGGAGMAQVTLTEPGTYCFLLTVDDIATNYQRARRFLIYDDVNNVTVDTHQPLWTDSAAVNTSRLWHTNLQDSRGIGTKVSLKWPGRYRNLFHHQHKLLAAIEPYDPPIAAGYEIVTGQPPQERSRQAIPNAYGITKVETAFSVDHNGGRSITTPPNTWTTVPDVTAEGVDLDVPRVDGDSVRLWVRAYDVVGNSVQEEVLLHVDSSPPVVQNFWLNRHGVPALAVHHSSDLFTMRFEFEAYDVHSGLHNIHWSLQDFLDSSTVHGEGQVAVRRPSLLHPECPPPDCACIPKDSECYFRNYEIVPDLSKMDIPVGSHDHDYVFVITVTNNAMLVTTVTFQVTVDESPPTAGQVQDALQGQRDLDYQQDLQLHAWWDGFFDRESGVQFYQYSFANRCLGEDEFSIPQSQQIHNTTGKFSSWTAPVAGTYFCTVVAYNPALSPSQPACSDGITVDASPPSVQHVKLTGFHARPGLVRDDGGNVWIVNRNGEREVVTEPPESCRNASRHVEDMEMWPVAELPYKRNTTSQNCTEIGALSDMGYLPMENHLHVQWEGWDDESGIADYEVGLSSTESATDSPDIHPYTSTKSHPELRLYHPNLAQGVQFYIIIRATNRALLSTTKVFGPVTVDITPPVIEPPINVTHTTDNSEDFLLAVWPAGSIYDTEDLIGLELEVAAGHSPGGTELSVFALVESFLQSNSLCPTASCVALPMSHLEWHLHGNQVYYVTLRVTNSAGLTSTLTSDPYHHNVELPSVGVVFEVADSTDTLRNPPDIDHQTNQTQIRCRWFGFAHAYQDIRYHAGLGSSPGLDDVVNFEAVGSSTSHIFTGLSLQHFQRYYVTVVARTEAGEVNTTSDGVAVLPQDGELAGATVSDGSCHTSILFNASLLTHHTSTPFPGSCADDVDFQASTTTVHTYWSIPEPMEDFVSYVHWTLEREQSVGGTTWETVKTIQDAPNTGVLVASELQLSPGGHYRSALHFCHQDGCFQPTASDGFWVTSEPPEANGINSIDYDETNTSLTFSWKEFVTAELAGHEALQTMAMGGYEWTLSVSGKESSAMGTILYPWQPILDLRRSGLNITATVTLPSPLEFSSCIKLFLRGRNQAGLYSVTSGEIHDCNDPGSVNIRDPVVFDAVPDFFNATVEEENGISLATNHFWTVPDEDFTRSRDTLAAAWPSLRHGDYYWKVLSAESIERWSFHRQENEINYHSFRCDEPETLRCGETKDNFVNVQGLELQNGQRYFVCVFAEETTLEYEKFQHVAAEVSVCSNGVVVDTEPPVAGEVHAGWGNQNYQTSTTELPIVWESFRDVEVHGNTGHQHSGVMKYEYAIGTSPGVMDVRQFVDVGLTNHVVARGLLLQSGHTYYVTVRATDHVGLQTTSTSEGLTIDTTPPSVTNTRIDVGGRYLMSTDVVSVNWDGLFFDLESGVKEYAWCMGSQPGHDDVMPYVDVGPEEQASSDPSTSLGLLEGHTYFVTIKATNWAGLVTTASSYGFIVEASPPLPGFVHDGGQQDIDYQHDLSTMTVTWGGFHEPHTDIAEYSWMIGTCSGCDDVMEEQHVGLLTEASANDLNLHPGVKYVVTVTACNSADLCTTLTSDGVIPDTSPPVAGVVLDGGSDGDIQYQASRTSIRAHWYNFHDPHTGLSHYEWRVGTSPGAEDILPSTRLHLTEQGFVSGLDPPLPLGVTLFVTVKAYNRAGLSVEKSSNGFTVDNTAPTPVISPTVDSAIGSVVLNTQILRDSLRTTWDFEDPESPLQYHIVSLYTHHQSDLTTEPVQLAGDTDSHTFSNLTLHDGDVYYVKVTACNAAMLCTTRESPGHMVDSSPPTVGTFAVATDHVTQLGRDVDGHMTYWQTIGSAGPHLRLAWLGFADPHSGINHYLVTVGTSYSGTDLTLTGPVRLNHSGSFQSSGEGQVQLGTVPVSRDLVPGEKIYISLWAVNTVGLNSDVAHATFEAVRSNPTSGLLDLVRRCDAQSCQGHCTCAPNNQQCQPLSTACNDVTGNPQYTSVEVFDTLSLQTTVPDGQDVNFTRSATSLAATWRAEQDNRIPVDRYEWSAGLAGEAVGSHVFDTSTDRIWHDVGSRTSAVLILPRDGAYTSLEPRVPYVWYVRAWYSQNDFAIFTSDGVKSLPLPPQVSASRKVKDLENISTNKDRDFTTSPTLLAVSWDRVFPDPFGEINNFQVALGTAAGASDIIAWGVVRTAPDVTRTSLDNLSLQSGVTYYSSVRATNHAGLYTTMTSDGIKVDTVPPTAGTVYDGLGLHDADYQNDSHAVWATWHGFSDLESYIHHYVWCVGSSPGAEDLLACRDLGVQISATEKLSQTLVAGTKYYSTVTAVDAAGLSSSPVSSSGITVDSTPPVPVEKLNFLQNLVHNPSFEQTLTASGWNVSGTAEAVATSGFATKDGHMYLHLHGSISQKIPTQPGQKYQLTFHVRHVEKISLPLQSQEGKVSAPGLHKTFKLYQRFGTVGHSEASEESIKTWHQHFYYFTSTNSESEIMFSSVGRAGMVLDQVSVRLVNVSRLQGADRENSVGLVHVHTSTAADWHVVQASWDMEDLESPVVKYEWAIGTVQGGTQLQGFKSVGQRTSARNESLHLQHGSSVHVTVVATNAAELRTVVYSEPAVVDLTPPVISNIKDGTAEDDTDYQSSLIFTASWEVTDEESGVSLCESAQGLSPGSTELSHFQPTDKLSSSSTNLTGLIRHGQTVYTTVRCRNRAGLESQVVTDVVTLVTRPPDSAAAKLRVTSPSQTPFPAESGHQSAKEQLRFFWEGFTDEAGIDHYEISISGPNNSTHTWLSAGVNGETSAALSGLRLEPQQTYTVFCRAVNTGGLVSDAVWTNVTIETEQPTVNGSSVISQWQPPDILHLDWTGNFLSQSELVYEVSMGTVRGGSDVMQWVETMETAMTVTGVDHSRVHYVIITAINRAGLYVSQVHRLSA